LVARLFVFGPQSATLAASNQLNGSRNVINADELAKLADLHQRNILTDEEFARAKERLLRGDTSSYGAVPPSRSSLNGLRRSSGDRWLGGVCGGLGQFLDVPAWVWRLVFVALFFGAGTGLLAYLLLWIFIPMEYEAIDYRRV
jgi:phage shock protein PspC (stress-responsive transcriptional regulator)